MAKVTSSVETRERIVTATNELFRRSGYNGTSLSQIVKASEATTGSLYHFFPGGKDELTAVVLRTSGASYAELVEMIVRAAIDPAVGMREAFDGAAALMVESDFIDPCPIGTIAREVASSNEALREVAAEVMRQWADMLSDIYVGAGVPAARAATLATTTIAVIEGGFILARTHRDVAPFLAAGDTLQQAIAAELPD